MVRALFALVCLVVAGGCSSTRLTSVWQAAPEAGANGEFSNIVVAALFADEVTRRAAEDELVGRIGEERATPSYRVESLAGATDPERVRSLVRRAGFDGALVMRVVGTDRRKRWIPGTVGHPAYYHSFHLYYAHAGARAYGGGYYRTDRILQIETVFYALADGQEMVWGARSETFNPTTIRRTVREVVNAIGARLRTDGLIG